MPIRWSPLVTSVFYALALTQIGGCSKDKSESEPEPAASAAQPVADTKIAKAVEQLTAKGQPAGDVAELGAGAQDGPPPDGVMTPQRAETEHKAGTVAELTLATAGSEPKVRLGPAPNKARGDMEVAVRRGQSMMPVVRFDLGWAAKAPKQAEETQAPALHELTLKVTGADAAAQQPGRIPPELPAQIKRLKGSKFGTEWLPSGAHTGFSFELSRGTDEAFGSIMRGVIEVLDTVALPYPNEPVGAGAVWMVKSRERYDGLDMVAYRMVRVESITDGVAKLSVRVRRYFAAERIERNGLPHHKVAQFQGDGEAQFELDVGTGLPKQGRAQLTTIALLELTGKRGGAGQDQYDVNASFQFESPKAPTSASGDTPAEALATRKPPSPAAAPAGPAATPQPAPALPPAAPAE